MLLENNAHGCMLSGIASPPESICYAIMGFEPLMYPLALELNEHYKKGASMLISFFTKENTK